MTRVLVDLLFMDGHKGGMEMYVQNLYARFDDPRFELVGFASAELSDRGAPWFPGEMVTSGVSGADRRAWARGEILAVGAAAKRAGAGLIHSPANFGPWSGSIPVVLTIHDLMPFRLRSLTGRPGPFIRTLTRRSAAHATRIITDSEQSRLDIEELLRPRVPVDVIPLAGGSIAPGTAVGGREPDLLLALGNRLPHKNFDTLLRALSLLPAATRPRLVVAGGSADDPLRPLVAELGLGPWVELAGWLPATEIEALYARAAAVVIPTLFEGFGLPVLEGMARGCPVICSELPVLREVGGEAAAYFDPRDARSMSATIAATLADPARLADLAILGTARNALFSWTRTAQRTGESFTRALEATAS